MKKKVKHLLASACTALFLSTLTAFSAFAELQQGPAYLDTEISGDNAAEDGTFEETLDGATPLEPGPGYEEAVAETIEREGLKEGNQDGPGRKKSKQDQKHTTAHTSGTDDSDDPDSVTGVPLMPYLYTAEEVAAMTGSSLGEFKVSGYCGCSECSSGFNLTYSGTVPMPEHTIAADLDLYPIGTRLIIDGIVYTVEDTGSMVNGNHIDIFFDSHETALNFGLQTLEVFYVKEP